MAAINLAEWTRDLLYPIGTYVWCTNSPASKIGGTWSQIAAGTFLCAAGTNYTNGSTGGKNKVQLSVNEMPSHSHSIVWGDKGTDPLWGLNLAWNVQLFTVNDPSRSIDYTGGSQSHENRPPYRACNLWYRTA